MSECLCVQWTVLMPEDNGTFLHKDWHTVLPM